MSSFNNRSLLSVDKLDFFFTFLRYVEPLFIAVCSYLLPELASDAADSEEFELHYCIFWLLWAKNYKNLIEGSQLLPRNQAYLIQPTID